MTAIRIMAKENNSLFHIEIKFFIDGYYLLLALVVRSEIYYTIS